MRAPRKADSRSLLELGVVALLAARFPFLTYVVSLSVAAIPHVLREADFLRRDLQAEGRAGFLRGRRGLVIGLALLTAVLARRQEFVAADPSPWLTLELLAGLAAAGFGAGLAEKPGPLRPKTGSDLTKTAALGLLVMAAIRGPFTSILIFAFAHNVLPVIFLKKAGWLRPGESARWLIPALVVLPVAVFLTATSDAPPVLDPATLSRAYLPDNWIGTSLGTRIFAVAAYLQCFHYFSILRWLPLPASRARTRLLLAAGSLATAFFALNFLGTRISYAALAAFHAWSEGPMLALWFVVRKGRTGVCTDAPGEKRSRGPGVPVPPKLGGEGEPAGFEACRDGMWPRYVHDGPDFPG